MKLQTGLRVDTVHNKVRMNMIPVTVCCRHHFESLELLGFSYKPESYTMSKFRGHMILR